MCIQIRLLDVAAILMIFPVHKHNVSKRNGAVFGFYLKQNLISCGIDWVASRD
jgi:hypothetical protein